MKARYLGLHPSKTEVVITGWCIHMTESIYFIKVFPWLDFLKVKFWPFLAHDARSIFVFFTMNRGWGLPGD